MMGSMTPEDVADALSRGIQDSADDAFRELIALKVARAVDMVVAMRTVSGMKTTSEDRDRLVLEAWECLKRGGNMIGGMYQLEDGQIHTTASIECPNAKFGERYIIRHHAEIEGRDISIGHHFYMDAYAHIGGGSSMDAHSKLTAGNYLHMGRFSHINTAREVIIGDEVGLGIQTKVFTHGAYLSAIDGFPYKFAPVRIGNRVWLPCAIVNPGVTIGDDVVVLPNSVVTKDLPSNCLAAGTPAKILTRDFPPKLSADEKAAILREIVEDSVEIMDDSGQDFTDVYPNQLRRYGTRGDFVSGNRRSP